MFLFGHTLLAFALFGQPEAAAQASAPTWLALVLVGLIAVLMVAVTAIVVALLIVVSRRKAPNHRPPARPGFEPDVSATDAIRSGQPPPHASDR